MAEEAPLRHVGSGLVPERDGWFVVNAREAAWTRREGFGFRCSFAADGPALRGVETDLEPWSFPQLGINLAVVGPGDRSTLYHAELGQQEAFLVLRGSCTLVIEEQEREVREWDFVHCPSGTRHTFVNHGEEPCVLLMVGARRGDATGIVYPRSELALAHGAGVEVEATSPEEAYAPYPHWRNANEPNPGKL
jgi:uncharacterized cupin superfamily protein